MAKDVTISVGGRNPDGTYSATIGGIDPTNPLLQAGSAPNAQTTAMMPWPAQPQPMPMPMPYRVQLGNQTISFASEADWLRMEQLIQQYRRPPTPFVNARFEDMLPGSEESSNKFLRTGAHVAEAVGGFLRDRNVRRKLDDLNDALDRADATDDELSRFETANPSISPLLQILRRRFDAERDATEASLTALEDELLAVDIGTGAGVAKVVSDFMSDAPRRRMGSGESGIGTALAVGGAGLGLGLLLSRDSSRRRR